MFVYLLVQEVAEHMRVFLLFISTGSCSGECLVLWLAFLVTQSVYFHFSLFTYDIMDMCFFYLDKSFASSLSSSVVKVNFDGKIGFLLGTFLAKQAQ